MCSPHPKVPGVGSEVIALPHQWLQSAQGPRGGDRWREEGVTKAPDSKWPWILTVMWEWTLNDWTEAVLGETQAARGFYYLSVTRKIVGSGPRFPSRGRGETGPRGGVWRSCGTQHKGSFMMTSCRSCLFIIRLHVQNPWICAWN